MKRSLIILIVLVTASLLGGCILSKTPSTNSVAMPLGDRMTFIVNVFPPGGTFAWTLDDEPLSNTGKSYVYTAEAGDHILVVKAKQSLGTDTQTWNITCDPTHHSVSGIVQKGPFISGSSITIQELDEGLNPTGTSFQTETMDDFGMFTLGSIITSQYIEIIASGYYFNEVIGALSNAPLTLRALSDLSSGNEVKINPLTSIEGKRIKKLIAGGKSFNEARTQAEIEILKIFKIENVLNLSSFDRMDISQEGDSNAILLAVSSILQINATEAQLSELISKISLDIENDGTLDNQTYINLIKNNSTLVDSESIKNNLMNRFSELGLPLTTIPDMNSFVDSDGDGIINRDDRLTVTYNGNGNDSGSVPVDPTGYQIIHGQTATVLGNTGNLVKTNYLFVGWNTQSNGGGVTYTPGQTFTLGNVDVTFYAKWAKSYTVTYNGNGNTGGSVPTDSNSYQQGQTVTVIGNIGNLVKTESTFVGWSTQSNGGGTTYTQGQSFTVGIYDTTLYAKWSINEYTVTFDSNGGSSVPAGTYDFGTSISEPTTTKLGYLFLGWYDNGNNKINFPYTIQSGDVTFIAVWFLNPIISDLLDSMVYIPAGSFQMGSTDDEYGWADYTTPVHQVTLQAFEIGAYEVTQAQYKAVMGVNPSFNQGSGTENNPVETVSWYDAREFCTRLSALTGRTFTLPSEAQWEYACRAGSTTRYCFGDEDALLGNYAWYSANSNMTTHPVGTKLPNAWGLYDMHGNVSERVLDLFHSNYNGAPTDGSAWEPEKIDFASLMPVRGGTRGSVSYVCVSALRIERYISHQREGDSGFRIVALD